MLDKFIKNINLRWLLLLVVVFSTCVLVAQKSRILKNWSVIVSMDGRGYYAYLPAVFIFQDLGFDFYEKHSPVPGDEANFLVDTEGGKVNKYSYGVALVLLPFFLIGWGYSFIFGYDLTGYSQPFYHAIWFGAVFYLMLGLYYLRKLLGTFGIKQAVVYLVLGLIVFATNLFHYTVFEPSMSHVYSFAAVGAFCFYSRRFFLHKNQQDFLWASFVLGLVVVIRPVNALLILCTPFLAGSLPDFANAIIVLFRRHLKYFVGGVLVFFMVVGIQSLFWHLQTGSWLVYSYGGERFVFANPEILNVLFSYRKGLFLYAPLLLLSLLGFNTLLRHNLYAFISLICFLIILVYVFSSWENWHYGWSFGQRGFIDFYAIFAVLLALFLNGLKSLFSKSIAFSAIVFVFVLSAIQTYQINNHILLYDNMDEEGYWEVFMKTGSNLPGLLEEKAKQNLSNHHSNSIAGLTMVYASKINFEEEQVPRFWNLGILHRGKAYSGEMANLAGTSATHYSSGFSAKIADISDGPIKFLKAKVMVSNVNNKAPYFLIISVKEKEKVIQNNSIDLSRMPGNERGWNLKEFVAPLPKSDPEETTIEVFIGSSNGAEILIDDFELFFY